MIGCYSHLAWSVLASLPPPTPTQKSGHPSFMPRPPCGMCQGPRRRSLAAGLGSTSLPDDVDWQTPQIIARRQARPMSFVFEIPIKSDHAHGWQRTLRARMSCCPSSTSLAVLCSTSQMRAGMARRRSMHTGINADALVACCGPGSRRALSKMAMSGHISAVCLREAWTTRSTEWPPTGARRSEGLETRGSTDSRLSERDATHGQ